MCCNWSLLKFVTYRKSGIRVYDLLESLNMVHLELTQKLEDTHSEKRKWLRKTIANSSKKSWVLIKEIKETANWVGGQMDAPKQIGKHVTTQRSHCQYL
jgi:hypothetical protein